MASSSVGIGIGSFDLFEAIYGSPDLLDLVVQQCSGDKNDLRLACSRLRASVDACVTALERKTAMFSDPSVFLSEFNAVEGAKNMAALARCPRLQTLDFGRHQVTDLSPLAACVGLQKVTLICTCDNLAPFAVLTRLEHLDCSCSAELSDISALAACTALKYLDCGMTKIKQLPPLPSLETLICNNTGVSNISALIACTALKHLDCRGTCITFIPPLPAGLETLFICGTQCLDLTPLAACVGLRFLNCIQTPVRDLMPLEACKRLEVLRCDRFDVIDDQISLLLHAKPDLYITDGHDNWEDEEKEDEAYGYGSNNYWEALAYELKMERRAWGDASDSGTNDDLVPSPS